MRIDRPAPYVQAIEDGRVVLKTVALGVRGNANGEAMVAVTGLTEGAQVIRANVGALREGTPVRFTLMGNAVAAAPAALSASGVKAP